MRGDMNNDRSTGARHLMLALVPAAVLWMASPLQAQSWVTPYRPSRPALSPYMYLTRPDVRGFPNYQAFVEPLRDQRQNLYNQEAEITRLRCDLGQQQSQIRPADAAPTGARSTYGNYSHYYPGASGGGSNSGSRNVTTPPRRVLASPFGRR